MRDLFPEYYPLTDEQVQRCVTAGTIVLDTNVLLALYRFSTSERQYLLALLERVQERLWIPYQVAVEFQRNRETVVAQQAGQYNSVVALVSGKDPDESRKKLRSLTLPDEVLPSVESLVEDYLTAMRKAAAPFIERAETIRAEHVVTRAQAQMDDPVRGRLDTFFVGRVGTKPDDATTDGRIQEALRRYESEIPPGFKDAGKDTDERKAGDYLLWAQVLDHAATLGSVDSLLFVTSDAKEDWFRRDGAPLPELRREFGARSEATYHQVSLSDFLNLANKHLSADVPGETIERANTMRLDATLPHLIASDPRDLSKAARSNVARLLLAREHADALFAPDAVSRAFLNLAAETQPGLLTPQQLQHLARVSPDLFYSNPTLMTHAKKLGISPIAIEPYMEFQDDDENGPTGDGQ